MVDCEMMRSVTAVVTFITVAFSLTVFVYRLMVIEINVSCNEDCTNRWPSPAGAEAGNDGVESAFDKGFVEIQGNSVLGGSSRFWTGNILADLRKSNVTDESTSPLEYLTVEVTIAMLLCGMGLPLALMLVSLWWKLYVYENEAQCTHQGVVTKLNEQKSYIISVEYKVAKLVVAKRCDINQGFHCNDNRQPARVNNNGRKHVIIKRNALELKTLASSTENLFGICDGLRHDSSIGNPDSDNSLALYECTGKKSFLTLKLDCDIASNIYNSCPSSATLDFLDDQAWISDAPLESQSAISGETKLRALLKDTSSSVTKVLTTVNFFLDTSVAGPSRMLPFVSVDAQPFYEQKLHFGSSWLKNIQSDLATRSLPKTSPSAPRSVCSGVTKPSPRTTDNLDMLWSFPDNEGSKALISARINVQLNWSSSMPGFLEACFTVSIQTPRCSHFWTGNVTAFCASRGITGEIFTDFSIYKMMPGSLEGLQPQYDEYLDMGMVYLSYWCQGDNVIIETYECESLSNCSSSFSDGNMSPRAQQRDNDIFDTDIDSSGVVSNDDMLQDSPQPHDFMHDDPQILESHRSYFQEESLGTDFQQYNPICNLGVSSFEDILSPRSEIHSDTSSIDSDLERELFGDPNDIGQTRPSLYIVDLDGSMMPNHPPNPRTSTLASSIDDCEFKGAVDQEPLWLGDSLSSSTGWNLETLLSGGLLESNDSDTSPFNTGYKHSDPDTTSESCDSDTSAILCDSSTALSESCDSDTSSELSNSGNSDLQQKIIEKPKSMLPESLGQRCQCARSLPMDKFCLEDQLEKGWSRAQTRQNELWQFDLTDFDFAAMESERPMQNCSSLSHSSAILQMPSDLGRVDVPETTQISSEEDASFDECAELNTLDAPETEISMKQPNKDQLPQNRAEEEESNKTYGVLQGATDLQRSSKHHRRYPRPSIFSDDTFLGGLRKPVRNDRLATVISAKAPVLARRALLDYLKTDDDYRYTPYKLELYSQMTALIEWERVRFCSETQRKNKLALSVLEKKRDNLKAKSERPKRAFARFFWAIKNIRKTKQRGEKLIKVCGGISALRRKIVECAEVHDEVQEQMRRPQLREQILACEKALVNCARRS